MTYANTWTNSDGLVVGFGTNSPERNAAGRVERDGGQKEARVQFDLVNSTSGSSGAVINVPAGSVVKHVYALVTEAAAGGTSLAFGDAGSTGGWITAAQGATANLTLNATIDGGGAYAIGGTDATASHLPKVYAAATDLYFTLVGTFTAGKVTVVVEYN